MAGKRRALPGRRARNERAAGVGARTGTRRYSCSRRPGMRERRSARCSDAWHTVSVRARGWTWEICASARSSRPSRSSRCSKIASCASAICSRPTRWSNGRAAAQRKPDRRLDARAHGVRPARAGQSQYSGFAARTRIRQKTSTYSSSTANRSENSRLRCRRKLRANISRLVRTPAIWRL